MSHLPDPLFHALQRAASEVVGAAELFALLRPHLDFDGYHKALAKLAEMEAKRDAAKLAWENDGVPVVYATPQQKEEIRRLYNQPGIVPSEKAALILELNRMSSVRASAIIVGLKLTVNERRGYVVYPEVVGCAVVAGEVVEPVYGVAGEVFQVKPACDCESDGCSWCVDGNGKPLAA